MNTELIIGFIFIIMLISMLIGFILGALKLNWNTEDIYDRLFMDGLFGACIGAFIGIVLGGSVIIILRCLGG